MPNPSDLRNAQSADVHIRAAKAAPHRKQLELNQAEAFARLITDKSLRETTLKKVAAARQAGGAGHP